MMEAFIADHFVKGGGREVGGGFIAQHFDHFTMRRKPPEFLAIRHNGIIAPKSFIGNVFDVKSDRIREYRINAIPYAVKRPDIGQCFTGMQIEKSNSEFIVPVKRFLVLVKFLKE